MEYLITAICSLVGTVIGALMNSSRMKKRLDILESKVDKINNISIEQAILREQINDIKRRLDLIERRINNG